MTKGQELKNRLWAKGIPLTRIAKEYDCSYQFVQMVLTGKAVSQPLINFIESKLT